MHPYSPLIICAAQRRYPDWNVIRNNENLIDTFTYSYLVGISLSYGAITCMRPLSIGVAAKGFTYPRGTQMRLTSDLVFQRPVQRPSLGNKAGSLFYSSSICRVYVQGSRLNCIRDTSKNMQHKKDIHRGHCRYLPGQGRPKPTIKLI